MYYDVYPFKDDTLLLSYDEIAFDEVPASEFILMQSTELKDKNDNEIFEGDIVKYKYKKGTFTDIVTYSKFYAFFGLKDDTGDLICSFDWLLENVGKDGFEVIGNIYENHELLEGK
nr:MAG TPA: YopX protein [Caudoviricetes sp.]